MVLKHTEFLNKIWGIGWRSPQQAVYSWLRNEAGYRSVACYSYTEFGIKIVIPKKVLYRILRETPYFSEIPLKLFGIIFCLFDCVPIHQSYVLIQNSV